MPDNRNINMLTKITENMSSI